MKYSGILTHFLYLSLISISVCFIPSSVHRIKSGTHTVVKSHPLLDQSLFLSDLFPQQTNDLANDLQNVAIIVSAAAYFAYEKRPRGAAVSDLLEVKRSTVKGANLGLFSKVFIPKGTSLGYYPGLVTSVESALRRKKDDKAKASAKKYMWMIDEDTVLDPTNRDGLLAPSINYFFGTYKVDTLLARINEPGPGLDVNVVVKNFSGADMEIVAERDILAGEELFIDYGLSYDRSEYGSDNKSIDSEQAAKDADLKRRMDEMAKIQAEIDSLTLQPISKDTSGSSTSSASGSSGGSSSTDREVIFDQDTTVKDGFIDKLTKAERANNASSSGKKSGIMTPEEGMNMFNEMGAGMFASPEDRELLESLLGKKKSKKGKKAKKIEEDDEEDEEDDEDEVEKFMNINKNSLGGAATDDEVEFLDSFLGRPTSSPSKKASKKTSSSKGFKKQVIDSDIDDDTLLNDEEYALLQKEVLEAKKRSNVRSIFENKPDALKSPAEEEKEVDEEIEQMLVNLRRGKSITEIIDPKSSKSSTSSSSSSSSSSNSENVSKKGGESKSFVEEFSAHSFRGLEDIDPNELSIDDDDDDDDDDSRVITTEAIDVDDEKIEKMPTYTSKEIQELQKRIDTMSDDDIKALFNKVKDSLGQDVGNAVLNNKQSIPGFDLFTMNALQKQQQEQKDAATNKKRLNKAKPVDEKIREKYKQELDELEAELEKMYENPLAVWQDMIMNPDKLKDDNEDYK